MIAEPRRRLVRLGAIHALLEFHFWFPIWIVFLLDRGISLSWIVAADAYFRILLVALELPLGIVGDRLGRKRTYITGALFAVGAYGTFALTNGIGMLFVCWTLWAFAIAFISGTDTAYQYEAIVGSDERPSAIAVFGRIRAAGAFALLISYLTAGWLYEQHAALPLVLNAAAACGAVLLLWGAHEVPLPKRRRTHWSGTLRDLLTRVRGRTDVRLAVLLLAGIGAYYWTVTLLIQPLLVERGLSPAAFGPVFALFCIAGIGASLLSGRFARAVGQTQLVLVGSTLLVAGVAILAFVPGPGSLAGLAVLGFGFFLAEPVTKVILNDVLPDDIRASAISLASLIASALLVVSRPLVGILTERRNAVHALVVWAAVGVAFLLFSAWALRTLDPSGRRSH